MILFDVNILVYAHREDQLHHAFFREQVERRTSLGEPFGLTPLAAGGFIRAVTQSAFPGGPTPLPQALAVIETLSAHPDFHWVLPGRRHWEIFSSLLRQTQSAGKSAADAQHAAIAIEHAATWITRDQDFARFREHGLKVEFWHPPA